MIKTNMTIKDIDDKVNPKKDNKLQNKKWMDDFRDILLNVYDSEMIYEFLSYSIDWFNEEEKIRNGVCN